MKKQTILRLGAVAATTVPFIVVLCGSTKTQKDKDNEDIKAVIKQFEKYKVDSFKFKYEGTDFNNEAKEKLITELIKKNPKKCKIEVIGSLEKEKKDSIEIQVSKGEGKLEKIELNVLWGETAKEVAKDNEYINEVSKQVENYKTSSFNFQYKGTDFNNEVKTKLITELIKKNPKKCKIKVAGILEKGKKDCSIEIQVSKGEGKLKKIELTRVSWLKTNREIEEEEVQDNKDIAEVVKQLEKIKDNTVNFQAQGKIFNKKVKSILIKTLHLKNHGCTIKFVIGQNLTKNLTKKIKNSILIQVSKGTVTPKIIKLTNVFWSMTNKEKLRKISSEEYTSMNKVVDQIFNLLNNDINIVFKAKGNIFDDNVKTKLIEKLELKKYGCTIKINRILVKGIKGDIQIEIFKGNHSHTFIMLRNVLWSKTDK